MAGGRRKRASQKKNQKSSSRQPAKDHSLSHYQNESPLSEELTALSSIFQEGYTLISEDSFTEFFITLRPHADGGRSNVSAELHVRYGTAKEAITTTELGPHSFDHYRHSHQPSTGATEIKSHDRGEELHSIDGDYREDSSHTLSTSREQMRRDPHHFFPHFIIVSHCHIHYFGYLLYQLSLYLYSSSLY
ncbi:hypothetical protein L7F22_014492 [Adiantum nelumboides]|nr:hypothetical protein [Adiantum nelumboides]